MPFNAIILQNANLLSKHQDTLASKQHILTSSTDGKLSLLPFESAEDQNELLVASESYLVEHFSQFEALIRAHYSTILNKPKATLRQKYEFIILLQGLSQLSLAHLIVLEDLSLRLELSEIANASLKNTLFFIFQIRVLQKNILYNFAFNLEAGFTSFEMEFTSSEQTVISGARVSSEPVYTQVSAFVKENKNHSLSISLTEQSIKWGGDHINPLSGRMAIRIDKDETRLPVAVLIQSDYSLCMEYAPQTFSALLQNNGTAQAYFQAQSLHHPSWESSYRPNTLRAFISANVENLNTKTLLLYLQTLVELTKLQPYHNQVVVYGPPELSARFYALGFYPDDSHTPKKETLEKMVSVDAYYQRSCAPHKKYCRFAENKEPLLRPFRFSLSELNTRPIHITENQVKTTYAALIVEPQTRLINPLDHPEGVLPVFHQPPITPSFRAIWDRKIGKQWTPKIHCKLQDIDYQWMTNDRQLAAVGCADQPGGINNKKLRHLTYS